MLGHGTVSITGFAPGPAKVATRMLCWSVVGIVHRLSHTFSARRSSGKSGMRTDVVNPDQLARWSLAQNAVAQETRTWAIKQVPSRHLDETSCDARADHTRQMQPH